MFKLWFILCMREWKRILGDVRILVLLLIGPFFYALVFGGVYWQGRTKSVPIVVVDQDHSELSREMTTALSTALKFKHSTYASGVSTAQWHSYSFSSTFKLSHFDQVLHAISNQRMLRRVTGHSIKQS